MKKFTELDEKKDEIIAYYNYGERTQNEVANYFNASRTAIKTRLKKWGVLNSDSNRRNRKVIPKDELYDMYWNKEMHPREIGEVFGCSFSTVHNYMRKYNIPFRTKSEARKGHLNPIYEVGHSIESRKKMSEAFINGNRKSFGYSGNWGNCSKYVTPNQGEVTMRSGWEIKAADYLSLLGLNWYYEYEWLKLDTDTNYLPDFYIPSLDMYIEVKGRDREEDLYKFKLARNKYNIILWGKEELLKLGLITNSGNTELNKKYRKRRSKCPLDEDGK